MKVSTNFKEKIKKIKLNFYYMGISALLLLCGCGEGKQPEGEAEQTAGNNPGKESVSENACAETGQEEERAEQLYEKYRDALTANDDMRGAATIMSGNWWKLQEGGYYEYIREYSFDRESYVMNDGVRTDRQVTMGILAAETGEESVAAMHIALYDEYGWTEYEYMDTGGILYFSCRGPERGGDLPDYWVCAYSLYGRQKKIEESLEILPKAADGYVRREYLVADGQVYAIDREGGRLSDMTGNSICRAADWLERTAKRVFLAAKVTPDAVSAVCRMEEPPYVWVDRFSKLAVCDLNNDGTEDYVAALVDPDSIGGNGKYIYKEERLYLYLSDGEGGYRSRVLVGENYASVLDLYFVSEGILVCQNYKYRMSNNEPHRVSYFRFDAETEEFLFAGEVERDASYGYFHIRGSEEGEYTMGDYYAARDDHWVTHVIYRMETEDGQELFAYCDSILAGSGKKAEDAAWEELAKNIREFTQDAYRTPPIREMSHAGDNSDRLRRSARELHEIGETGVAVSITYQNPKIICGYIETTKRGYPDMKFMIDRESGEAVNIYELVGAPEMLRICREGMRDSLHRPIDGEKVEMYLEYIEKGYESSGSHTPRGSYEENGLVVDFGMNEWGIYIELDADTGWRKVYLDKEYFMDTPLWKYWEAAVPWEGGE